MYNLIIYKINLKNCVYNLNKTKQHLLGLSVKPLSSIRRRGAICITINDFEEDDRNSNNNVWTNSTGDIEKNYNKPLKDRRTSVTFRGSSTRHWWQRILCCDCLRTKKRKLGRNFDKAGEGG